MTWEAYWQMIELPNRTRAASLRSTCKRYIVTEMPRVDGLHYIGRRIYYAIHAGDCGLVLISTHRQIRAAKKACENHAKELRTRHYLQYMQ